jgi:glycosyltransferase involved in cell wall biosynthesis
MVGKLKLCIVISNINKALPFEWNALALKDDYDLSYILLNSGKTYFEEFLITHSIKCTRVIFRGKKDILRGISQVLKIFLTNKPNIVHANFFEAQIIGLTAAWLAGVKKRIYTRHHSNYHHQYFPSSVKYDKWSNKLATSIVSISQATDKSLMDLEHVPISKIKKMHHALNFNDFLNISKERVNAVKAKWDIDTDRHIIGVISRFEKLKGYQYIIPAFEKYLLTNPTAVLVMANAKGPYQTEVLQLLRSLPAESYILIPFESDIAALYHTFDIYIHVPVDEMCEAFGLTYIEALALGIPSIFTRSGIAAEFIIDGENAIVVNFKSEEDIYKALIKLSSDKALRVRMSVKGIADVKKLFGFEDHIQKLQSIYL